MLTPQKHLFLNFLKMKLAPFHLEEDEVATQGSELTMSLTKLSDSTIETSTLTVPTITAEAIRSVVSEWSKAKYSRSNQLASTMKIERVHSQVALLTRWRSRFCIVSERWETMSDNVGACDYLNTPVADNAEAALQKITPIEVIQCQNCNGHRSVVCRNCGGHGEVTCRGCGGRGQNLVTKYRTETRTVYHGDYPYQESHQVAEQVWETCHGCGGRGRVLCPISDCNGGQIACKTCGATGEMTKVNIVEKLYTFLTVESFNDKTAQPLSHPFLENSELYKKSVFKKKYTEKIDEEEFAQKHLVLPQEELLGKMKRAHEMLRREKLIITEELLWQEIAVSAMPFHTATYNFKDQTNCVLYVYGDDNRLHMVAEHIDAGLVAIKYIATLAMVIAVIALLVFVSHQPAQAPVVAPTSASPSNNSTANQPQSPTDFTPYLDGIEIDSSEAISQMDHNTVQGKINDLMARFGYVFGASIQSEYKDKPWYHPQVDKRPEEIINLISENSEIGSYWKELVARRDEIGNQEKKSVDEKKSGTPKESLASINLPSIDSIESMDYATTQHHIHEMMAIFGFDFSHDKNLKQEFSDPTRYHPRPELKSDQVIALIEKNATNRPVFLTLVAHRNKLIESIYEDIKTAIVEAGEAEVKVRQANDISLMEGKYIRKELEELQRQIEASIEQKHYSELELVSRSYEDESFHLELSGQKAEIRFVEVWQVRQFSTETNEPISKATTDIEPQCATLVLKDGRWLIEELDFSK